MSSRLILEPGLLALFSARVEAGKHAHSAVQIVWPEAGASWVINGEAGSGAVMIGSNTPHDLVLEAGWIILLESQSNPGRHSQGLLKGQHWCSLPSLGDFQWNSVEAGGHCLLPVWQSLGMTDSPVDDPGVTDSRVRKLLQRLDRCFQQGGIDPQSWSAAMVAQSLSLSTSRFLHVFRAQMGMAWRPYLRWRRLLCAVQALLQGHSATHAALLAGFADSAHLSRTFHASFGMSIREALANFR